MNDLKTFLKKNKTKKLLAVFAHPDDESFVSGGLFQELQKMGIKATLICLTEGGRGLNAYRSGDIKKIRTRELQDAVKVLGIDEYFLWDYPDADLRSTRQEWVPLLKKEIVNQKPDVILTFDHSGITGHPDHIVSCVETLDLVRSMKNPPVLIWRVPDKEERKYFKDNGAFVFSSRPNLKLTYGLQESLTKIKAIFTHKSQMQGFKFKLQILEWFLFNHKELYYQVDLRKRYAYKFVFFRIDKQT